MNASLSAQDLLSLAAARQRREEMTAFLQDLVRIPSVNGRETELAVARRILKEAERLGFEGRLVGPDAERPNALVSWGEGPEGFALVGHMDTVAEGPVEAWRFPPFAAQIEAGRLYGRGAADNKAGLACGLYALALLRDHNLLDPRRSRVLLAGVVDEESGASSPLGVRWLLDQGLLKARGAIYTYAGDIICIGHRGLLRLVLRAAGKAVHSGSAAWSQGRDGANALTGLAAILLRLEALEIPTAEQPAFVGLGNKITPTLLRGGEFESMVPAHAEALVDVRLLPGVSPQGVVDRVKQAIAEETARRPGLVVSVEVKNSLPGAAIPADHPLVKLAEEYTQTLTGRTWLAQGAGPANEGYMLIQAGIPTLCGFGPQGDNAHAPDEWVDLESLPRTVAIYAGMVREYLEGGV